MKQKNTFCFAKKCLFFLKKKSSTPRWKKFWGESKKIFAAHQIPCNTFQAWAQKSPKRIVLCGFCIMLLWPDWQSMWARGPWLSLNLYGMQLHLSFYTSMSKVAVWKHDNHERPQVVVSFSGDHTFSCGWQIFFAPKIFGRFWQEKKTKKMCLLKKSKKEKKHTSAFFLLFFFFLKKQGFF